jgi:hypothetical protein
MTIIISIFILLLILHTYRKVPATNRYINNPDNPPLLKVIDVIETIGSIVVLFILILNFYNII